MCRFTQDAAEDRAQRVKLSHFPEPTFFTNIFTYSKTRFFHHQVQVEDSVHYKLLLLVAEYAHHQLSAGNRRGSSCTKTP